MGDGAINKHSQNVVDMKHKNQKVIGQASEALSSNLFTLMKVWKVCRANATISGEKRKGNLQGAIMHLIVREAVFVYIIKVHLL